MTSNPAITTDGGSVNAAPAADAIFNVSIPVPALMLSKLFKVKSVALNVSAVAAPVMVSTPVVSVKVVPAGVAVIEPGAVLVVALE